MSDAPTVELTREELLVLAAAVREMIKADGTITETKSRMAADLARRLSLDEDGWEAIWQEATRTLPSVDSVMEAAARSLHRIDARELIYELLYEIATDGTIVDSEWDLLEWLDETWRLVDSRRA